jgi:hypothetical protein
MTKGLWQRASGAMFALPINLPGTGRARWRGEREKNMSRLDLVWTDDGDDDEIDDDGMDDAGGEDIDGDIDADDDNDDDDDIDEKMMMMMMMMMMMVMVLGCQPSERLSTPGRSCWTRWSRACDSTSASREWLSLTTHHQNLSSPASPLYINAYPSDPFIHHSGLIGRKPFSLLPGSRGIKGTQSLRAFVSASESHS